MRIDQQQSEQCNNLLATVSPLFKNGKNALAVQIFVVRSEDARGRLRRTIRDWRSACSASREVSALKDCLSHRA
jgi:hypothetical protein